MFLNNIDRHKFQHSNVMDLFLKRKLSMLTLNLQIKFRIKRVQAEDING